MLDVKADQLARKCSEQQEEILPLQETLDDKEIEVKELIQQHKQERQDKDLLIERLKRGSQVFEDNVTQLENDYEKEILELKKKVVELENRKIILERETESLSMSGEVQKQIQAKLIQDNSTSERRVDKLTSTNTDLISQLERTEEIDYDLKEKLEMVTKQLTMKDVNGSGVSERYLIEEIEYLKELKKTMQTTIEVLTADKKMLGERLSMIELDQVKSERDSGKIFDITALETRIYERLLVKMKIEITNQMKEHKCPNKEQLKVLGRIRLTSKDFK
ncbi:hypothetical protein HHI36_015104 [Cryptolaemus montrouzieri]|uniref:Uncharacterized protein n=1 Tax=Cryptolaemus montrouzieri TaxID=559131 RepID=A0ABD2N523_9CUCU